MIENSLILTPNSTSSPYSKIDTANGMPINGPRIVNSVNNNLRSKEYAEKENLKSTHLPGKCILHLLFALRTAKG